MRTVNASAGIALHFGNVFEACSPAVYSNWLSDSSDSSMQGKDLFPKIRAYFEMQVKTFANLLRCGTLKFLPKLGCVSLADEGLIHTTAAAEPFSISWSNISD
jgi:hypothetical protein